MKDALGQSIKVGDLLIMDSPYGHSSPGIGWEVTGFTNQLVKTKWGNKRPENVVVATELIKNSPKYKEDDNKIGEHPWH